MCTMIRPTAAVRNECGLLRGPQSGMLHPNRAGAEQFRGVDVDTPEVGAPTRRRGSGADVFPGGRRGGNAPGGHLGTRAAAGEEFVDAPVKHRPLTLYDIEVSSEIGQGALAHPAADAFEAHGAEGEVPAVGAGAGAGA